jgi:hypothetical protein
MGTSCNKNNSPRNGTNRLNRLPKALDASFVAIDERDKAALYDFCEKLSAFINYYYFDSTEKSGKWDTVFKIEELRTDGSTEPHLGLFDAFLDLYAIAQKDLNGFTAKHLDYFFETVLGFKKKAAVPDKVYLTIQLAKHITQYILDDSTQFKAGKNKDKKEQFYKLLSEFSFSHAQVSQIRSILVDQDEKSRVYVSPVANSGDGIGGDLVNADGSWDTFGNDERPEAVAGFAISSPLFRMAEGIRIITLTINCIADFGPSPIIAKEKFRAYVSAEKGWTEISVESVVFTAANRLVMTLKATETTPKIVDYQPKLHIEPFETKYPVLKITVSAGAATNVYSTLTHSGLSSVKIDTSVTGVKNLLVQNSLGKLDPSKPMEIFGATPTIGANFYIGSSEVLQHDLNSLKLNFEFLNLPGISFDIYYKAYVTASDFYTVILDLNTYKAEKLGLKEKKSKESSKMESLAEDSGTVLFLGIFDSPVYTALASSYVYNSSFKAEVSYLYHRNWIPLPPLTPSKVNLFGTDNATAPKAVFSEILTVPDTLDADYGTNAGEGYTLDTERGFLKLKFTEGRFGHADYQLAYSRAILNGIDDPTKIELPNAPYTPLIQNLSLDYTCTATIDLSAAAANQAHYDSRVHEFFGLEPFGPAEVHPYTHELVTLLPVRAYEGELYIGLSDAVVAQNISLLFTVSEGSSDPDIEKAIVKWAYLEKNVWKAFKKPEILREQTNGLLTSGIVTLQIPKTATSDNTCLPSGLIWLRAAVENHAMAVCDIISIDAQACEAAFFCYDDVVPEQVSIPAGTISKLKEPDAAIKKILQPYASVNGKPAEQGNEYYLRVSERLRHKNRAITLWDYERLILAKFPGVYTVKCINHTYYNGTVSTYNSLSPGSVAIIAVPDISISNAPNPLKPKVSKNTLEEIRSYITKSNSAFAAVNVQNPIFEEIKLDFHVKLRDGYEENIYMEQLQQKIKSLLAPWISNSSIQLEFGGKIEKSTLIYQLEKLKYVDYVTCFKMYLFRPAGLEDISTKDLDRAETATAASILTSYTSHNILNIDDLPGGGNPDCDCGDCDDNVVKTNENTSPVNECGCNS